MAEYSLAVYTEEEPLNIKPLTVEEKILLEFPEAPIMADVAEAESKFNPLAKNPTSSAKGVFQILDGTWKGAKCEGDVLNEDDNIKCARILFNDSGLTPWNASREHWTSHRTTTTEP